MNRNQWLVLAWSCMIIGILFIGLDMTKGSCLNINQISSEPVNLSDVWCIVNAEIYEPFIYMFYSLWIVFLILAWLEPKKK